MSRKVRFFLTGALVLGALTGGTASALPTGVPSKGDLTSVVPVEWQGQVWVARESPVVAQNPNNNYWLATPDTVFTDAAGKLHLVAKKCGLNWCGVSIATTKDDYGYGTYRFVLDTPMEDFDPIAVLGMFTFNQDVLPSRQEIDVELSSWGQTDPKARNGQWCIQPWHDPGHLIPFTVPRTQPLSYEFTWRPKSVTFRARLGADPNGQVIRSYKMTKALPGKATPGTKVHLNLWFKKAQAPYNGQAQEAVFSSFTYVPRS